MGKSQKRVNDIAAVLLRLRVQHGENSRGLGIEPDTRMGANSWTCTRSCADPIEEWTCPQCLREYNGYGRTVVAPCWVCRDIRAIDSIGIAEQGDCYRAAVMSYSEQMAFDERDERDRLARLDDHYRPVFAELDSRRRAMRRIGATDKQLRDLSGSRRAAINEYRILGGTTLTRKT